MRNQSKRVCVFLLLFLAVMGLPGGLAHADPNDATPQGSDELSSQSSESSESPESSPTPATSATTATSPFLTPTTPTSTMSATPATTTTTTTTLGAETSAAPTTPATPATSTTSTTSSSGRELSTLGYSRLPFQLSASYRTGYDDNVTDVNTNKQPSVFSTIALQLAYGFGSPRTQVSLQAGASGTYYWDHPQGSAPGANQDYDINLNIGLNIVHQASPRLTLTISLSGAYVTEPLFADQIASVYRNGNFFYAQDQVSVAYLWTSRFQTVNSYSLFALHYDEKSTGLFEDRFEHTFGDQFKFILNPETALVAEYRFGLVDYSNEGGHLNDPHGQFFIFVDPMPPHHLHFAIAYRLLARNSLSNIILGGFDRTFSPRLSASFRGGVEFRDYYDFPDNAFTTTAPPGVVTIQGSHQNDTAPYIEASLNYAVEKQTTLAWTNRYGLDEPDVETNPVRTAYITGVVASHVFSDKLSANVSVYYSHSYYHTGPDTLFIGEFGGPVLIPGAPGFTEDAVDLIGQVSYKLTRHCSVDLGYEYSMVNSDEHFRDYDRNRVSGGLTYNF